VSALSRPIASASYGPRSVEFRQVGSVSVEETTNFCVSLKNGAAGVVLLGTARPRRLEHLIRHAPEQDGARAVGERLDRFAHFRVETEVERPGRRVDGSVERGELVDDDPAH
jgi:hypothetical protein